MDGTLTNPIHDFEAMRIELGLPAHQTILESIDELPLAKGEQIRQKLNTIELSLAHQATAAPGAKALLATLHHRGCHLGILTRNNWVNTIATLKAAGLADYFSTTNIITRDGTPPKPSPAGIHQLLDQWGADIQEALMIGDSHFDTRAGHNAGVMTIYIRNGQPSDPTIQSDYYINYLSDIISADV